jgi:hypothetical protein
MNFSRSEPFALVTNALRRGLWILNFERRSDDPTFEYVRLDERVGGPGPQLAGGMARARKPVARWWLAIISSATWRSRTGIAIPTGGGPAFVRWH